MSRLTNFDLDRDETAAKRQIRVDLLNTVEATGWAKTLLRYIATVRYYQKRGRDRRKRRMPSPPRNNW